MSVILMGKNTMMKRSIRMYCERTGNDTWLGLIDELVGNVGLVFTKGDLKDIKVEIAKYKVPAMARFGIVAPIDVSVKAGPTGMDPSATNFFQASRALLLVDACGANNALQDGQHLLVVLVLHRLLANVLVVVVVVLVVVVLHMLYWWWWRFTCCGVWWWCFTCCASGGGASHVVLVVVVVLVSRVFEGFHGLD
jgi:Ribosomal protein L10